MDSDFSTEEEESSMHSLTEVDDDSDHQSTEEQHSFSVQVETRVFKVQVQVRTPDPNLKVHVHSQTADVKVQLKPSCLTEQDGHATFLAVHRKNPVQVEININPEHQEHTDALEDIVDSAERTDKSKKQQIQALLERLNLNDRLEHKLTSAELLQIGSVLKHNEDLSERKLFSVYLHQLLMLDYRARYVWTKEKGVTVSNSSPDLHPLDIQMAVFHCSDSFLKQKMVTKLSQCQYALPLLVPEPFTGDIQCPLWTFRQIQKAKVGTMMSVPICKAHTPMVFCFRLGFLSVSKSQLINTLLDDHHSTFFQRDCPGSLTKSHLLIDGVAEITWCYPAGKPTDICGKLLQDWCRINKEQYRLCGDIEKEKCKKQNELQKIREDQCQASKSDLIQIFVRHLSSLSPTEREYFLTWTQILMDTHAIENMSSVQQKYQQTWTEFLALKKAADRSSDLKCKQAELGQISSNLQSVMYGLEHIFREMEQIYEAHKSLSKPPKMEPDWSKYPELAAELMISGHPMELMDGDAGHVPLIWISSLIDQIIYKLGDKRVFVLSVLGIQGSGKTTMLNAMFGLQFAVSAGRSTRGAFMQLVKLSEEIRKDFEWDYILVVDTEGLQTLQQDGNATIQRDNELATFVVGVGNMTLVNISGENPSEMQDVLQIVVQAFMRMKKVKLSPSCAFVYNKITDVEAARENMVTKKTLQETLDQIVKLAAKEEVCDAQRFSDIIDFDVDKDVNVFKGESAAVVLAEVICEKLKASMTETVCNRTAIDIAEEMKNSYPAFNKSRLNLEKYVLRSLAEKGDFNRYMAYIENPKAHIELFIKEEVQGYIQREKKAPVLLKKNVEEISNLVRIALHQATENVKEGNVEKWLQEFHSFLRDKLNLQILSHNSGGVTNHSFLRDAIEKRLTPITEQLKSLPLDQMNEYRLQPEEILIDQLCNCCWETCPFCAAVCTNTVKNHHPEKHSVLIHRPTGIEGWHIRGTLEMVIDFCPTLAASDKKFRPQGFQDVAIPYKQYQRAGGAYADWSITPDGSKLVYWKWFICHFQKELEEYHKLKFVGQGEIPIDWRKYSREQAIESLEEIYI
uniref:VLIG-type G domain-containing protein n=1 Tax=Knipowitschia caucasica TaxID=637954 RepID=A0AAV2KN06_KNICA